METWYSLSGYLSLKSIGALSLLLPSRRYWFAFNENQQTLQIFHTERDQITNKIPVESISIHRAGITLSPTEERLFIILTDNREYQLKADNHESLMIWLLGLQSKRDATEIQYKKSVIMEKDLISVQDPEEEHTNVYLYEETYRNLRCDSITRQPEYISKLYFERSFISDDEKCRLDVNSSAVESRKMSVCSNKDLCESCSSIICSECRTIVQSKTSSTLNSLTSIQQQQHLIESCYRTGSSSNSIESCDSAFCEKIFDHHYDGHSTQNHTIIHDTLLSLKCELASALNKECIYLSIIKEKCDIVRKLERQLSDIIIATTACNKFSTISKIFTEKTRETNNELKFLNCEIKKLHKLIRDDDVKIRKLIRAIRVQQTQTQGLQRDYVYLLQTSLSIEDCRLFGGVKHRERLKELLAECRKRDPSLPSFENLERCGCYIDSYGFKHEKNNENDMLQYICMKLTEFYDQKAHVADELLWRTLITSFTNGTTVSKSFKNLIRQGIPHNLRSDIWRSLILKKVCHIRKSRGTMFYQNLSLQIPESDLSTKFQKQIQLDLHRTMPTNIRFCRKDSDGIRQLREVLEVFCLYNPLVGYCQGMNFIVAIALLFLEPENAFWLLVAVTECYFPSNYYDSGLIGAQVDQFVLKDLIQIKAPELYRHFENIEVEITSLTLNWFMAVFIDTVPFETLLRIWDCFLLEGPKVLFRFAVALLIMNRDSIITKTDTISMMKQIKDSAKNLFDVESLFKIAFEDLKPFARRKDIAVKQAYYTKMLTEKILKRQLSFTNAFTNQDYVFPEINPCTCTLDCATVVSGGLLWMVFGSQFECRIFEVNIERGIMVDLELTYNSRAYCMNCIRSNLVLVGTLSGTLIGYSVENRNIQWATQLSSSVVCITHSTKEELTRAYCGLSDGSLAILELFDMKEPDEAFSISLGKAPITAIMLLNENLWCICSNKLSILNEKTLYTLISIELAAEYLEFTSILYFDEPTYVWLILRSSNTLQVWDNTNCKLYATASLTKVFNKLGKPNNEHELTREQMIDEEDRTLSEIRITSLLVHDNQLWLGISTGSIYVFDVNFQPKKKKSSIMNFQTDLSHYRSRSLSISSNLIDTSHRLVQDINDMNSTLLLDKRSTTRSYSESAVVKIDKNKNDFITHNDHEEWLTAMHLYRITFNADVIVTSDNSTSNSTKASFLRRRKRHHSACVLGKQLENGHKHYSLRNETKLKQSSKKLSIHKPKRMSDSDTSTTLASRHTRSSSPAIISTDEYTKHTHRTLSQSIAQNQKSIDTSTMTVNFNLAFKAKISDSPVKCICKTRYNDQTVIVTGQGKYGDEETVLRWKRVQDTTQWSNDVIVELSPDSFIPIRPQHARWKYFKESRDHSNSISSNF